MNVLKILPQTVFRNLCVHITDNQVASCPYPDLIGDMTGKNELAIVPREFELWLCISGTQPPRVEKDGYTLLP